MACTDIVCLEEAVSGWTQNGHDQTAETAKRLNGYGIKASDHWPVFVGFDF